MCVRAGGSAKAPRVCGGSEAAGSRVASRLLWMLHSLPPPPGANYYCWGTGGLGCGTLGRAGGGGGAVHALSRFPCIPQAQPCAATERGRAPGGSVLRAQGSMPLAPLLLKVPGCGAQGAGGRAGAGRVLPLCRARVCPWCLCQSLANGTAGQGPGCCLLGLSCCLRGCSTACPLPRSHGALTLCLSGLQPSSLSQDPGQG